MRLLVAVSIVIVTAAVSAEAQDAPKKSERARERVNKVWDAQLDRMREAQIAAACKGEAKEHYSAIRFNKRRTYVANCITEAHGPVVDKAGSIP